MTDREKHFQEAAELISTNMMKSALQSEQEVYGGVYFWNPRISEAATQLIDPTLTPATCYVLMVDSPSQF